MCCRAAATPQARIVNQLALPMPIPASSATVPPVVDAACAVDAAAKMAAQDAIGERVRGGGRERGQEGAPGRGDLLVGLAAEADAKRAPQRACAQRDEHSGAHDPQREAQRLDRDQRSRAGDAQAGVERVHHGRACADGEAGDERTAQHRADQEQGDRPQLGGDEQPEAEADGEGRVHPRIVADRAGQAVVTGSSAELWSGSLNCAPGGGLIGPCSSGSSVPRIHRSRRVRSSSATGPSAGSPNRFHASSGSRR